MANRKGSGRPKSAKRKSQLRRTIPVRAARDGSDLCLQCGLCCDGTLFSQINMQEDEREFVESLGLEVEVRPDGEVGAPEPCPAFVDGCCSLYQRGRPETCGSYRCALLEAYTSGSRELEDVLVTVGLVWSLARQLETSMALPLGSYNRRELHRYLDEHEPWSDPVVNARFLVAYHRLNLLGERYFGYVSKPDEVEAADAGAKIAAEEAEAVAGAPTS